LVRTFDRDEKWFFHAKSTFLGFDVVPLGVVTVLGIGMEFFFLILCKRM